MSELKRKGTSSNDNPNKRAQDASGNINGKLKILQYHILRLKDLSNEHIKLYFQIILVSRLIIDRILSKLSGIETKINTIMEEQKVIMEKLSAMKNKKKDNLLPVSDYTKFNLIKDFVNFTIP